MDPEKDFNEWRAERLGYVYFSRITDLIINEPNFKDTFFDYLIDIGDKHKQTGRLFGVEIKSMDSPVQKKKVSISKYKNVSIPALYVFFDTKTDSGYFKWIKKPKKNGQLLLDDKRNNIRKLDNTSLTEIVNEIKDWYSHRVA